MADANGKNQLATTILLAILVALITITAGMAQAQFNSVHKAIDQLSIIHQKTTDHLWAKIDRLTNLLMAKDTEYRQEQKEIREKLSTACQELERIKERQEKRQ